MNELAPCAEWSAVLKKCEAAPGAARALTILRTQDARPGSSPPWARKVGRTVPLWAYRFPC